MHLILFVQAGPHLVRFHQHPKLESKKALREFLDSKGDHFKGVAVAVDLDELGDVLEAGLSAWATLLDPYLGETDEREEPQRAQLRKAFGKAIVHGKERVCPELIRDTRMSSPPPT